MKLLRNLKGVLIEEIIRDDIFPIDEKVYTDDLELIDVDLELKQENMNSLIDDIYGQNDLSDKSQSIFKVEELLATLPGEMVTETKRKTILMILGSFGLNTPLLLADGEDRVRVLEVVKSKIVSESTQMISDKQADIENHKRSIALLEKQISDHKRWVMNSEDMLNNEMAAITQLINFLEGE